MLLDGGGAYSDSEVSSLGGDMPVSNSHFYSTTTPAKGLNGSTNQLISSSSIGISADFDKRKRKKHELLEEVNLIYFISVKTNFMNFSIKKKYVLFSF